MFDETSAPAGANPVGQIAHASPITQGFVWILRAWLDPTEGPNAVKRRLERELGDREADRIVNLVEAFFGPLAQFHSRPLQRRCLRCAHLGADEAKMGQILELSAFGQTASAMALAAQMVRSEGLARFLAAAPPLGRALLRFPCAPRDKRTHTASLAEQTVSRPAGDLMTRPPGVTLH